VWLIDRPTMTVRLQTVVVGPVFNDKFGDV